MTKTMPFCSSCSMSQALGEQDRISGLPDELLVSILSLLTINEAARTSVLSRRWETIWTSFNGTLNFDTGRRLYYTLSRDQLAEERANYLSWVNGVLASLSLQSIHLNEFILAFDMITDDSCHIDRWIEFALEKKRIKKFVLNLKPGSFNNFKRYVLSMEQRRGSTFIAGLTSLSLKHVNVSDQVIEDFLSGCPLLEQLHVECSDTVVNLKVATLKLKYLNINKCYKLRSMEIDCPNLSSLTFYGKAIDLLIKNAPSLEELSLGGGFHDYPLHILCNSLSNYFAQLETLTFHSTAEEETGFTELINLPRLKHLTLKIIHANESRLLGWTTLIEESPLLESFRLELKYSRRLDRTIEHGKIHPHSSLKVAELTGFVGNATYCEFAIYLIDNAVALEKLIIDCRFPSSEINPDYSYVRSPNLIAERVAGRLKRYAQFREGLDVQIFV